MIKSPEMRKLIEDSVVNSVAKTFSFLISEDEKRNQAKVSKEIDKLGLRASESKSAQDEDEEAPLEDPAPDGDSNSGVKKLPQPLEPSDAVKVLNIIRSGESLKDDRVMERFNAWWNTLTSTEKISLKAFLDGIAEIISGDSDPETASSPSRPPYNVDTSRVKDLSAKDKPAKTNLSQPSGTDSSPIIVGEVNSTLFEKSKMVD